MQISCPNCDQGIETTDEMVGNRMSCPACGHEIPLPARDDDESEDMREATSKSALAGEFASVHQGARHSVIDIGSTDSVDSSQAHENQC